VFINTPDVLEVETEAVVDNLLGAKGNAWLTLKRTDNTVRTTVVGRYMMDEV